MRSGLVDIRGCIATDPKQRYTDAEHYTLKTNEAIARCLLAAIGDGGRL